MNSHLHTRLWSMGLYESRGELPLSSPILLFNEIETQQVLVVPVILYYPRDIYNAEIWLNEWEALLSVSHGRRCMYRGRE